MRLSQSMSKSYRETFPLSNIAYTNDGYLRALLPEFISKNFFDKFHWNGFVKDIKTM
jgi:hypothetical protein